MILKVTISKARDLTPSDMNGLADPWLIAAVNDIGYKTAHISNTLNPEFNAEFYFEVQEGRDQVLNIVLWDRDLFTSDDHLGAFCIKIFEDHAPELKFNAIPKFRGENLQGSVEYKLEFVDTIPTDFRATVVDPFTKGKPVSKQGWLQIDGNRHYVVVIGKTVHILRDPTDSPIASYDMSLPENSIRRVGQDGFQILVGEEKVEFIGFTHRDCSQWFDFLEEL
ncbi:hypothetical protein PCE1_000133 [Barthelona sp. PCE]